MRLFLFRACSLAPKARRDEPPARRQTHVQNRKLLRKLWRKARPCLSPAPRAALLPQIVPREFPRPNGEGPQRDAKVVWPPHSRLSLPRQSFVVVIRRLGRVLHETQPFKALGLARARPNYRTNRTHRST